MAVVFTGANLQFSPRVHHQLITHTSFSTRYDFHKPNDIRALNLMNAAAAALIKDLPDISHAYGLSDEYRGCKKETEP